MIVSRGLSFGNLQAICRQSFEPLQVCRKWHRHAAVDQCIGSISMLGAAFAMRSSPAGQCSHQADEDAGVPIPAMREKGNPELVNLVALAIKNPVQL